jgi:hypothetical protein
MRNGITDLDLFKFLHLDGGEWFASRPGCFTPVEGLADTHWTGGWVSPRVGLDAMEWRKISVPADNRAPISQLSSP